MQRFRARLLRFAASTTAATVARQTEKIVRQNTADISSLTTKSDAIQSLALALADPATQALARDKAKIIRVLRETLDSDSPMSRLKAAELLGSIPQIDLWGEHNKPERELDPIQIENEIQQRLAALMCAPAASDSVVDLAPLAHESTAPGAQEDQAVDAERWVSDRIEDDEPGVR